MKQAAVEINSVWTELMPIERQVLLSAALLMQPISIDLLANVLSASAVTALQTCESLAEVGLLRRHNSGMGNYCTPEDDTGHAILEIAVEDEVNTQTRRLIGVLESIPAPDPEQANMLARLYHFANIPPQTLEVFIKAAEYCATLNLHKEVMEYYLKVVNSVAVNTSSLELKRIFLDAVMGLLSHMERSFYLPEQEANLLRALSYAREIGDQERLIRMLALVGIAYLWIVNFKEAEKYFKEAKEKAEESEDPKIIKHVTIIASNWLMWQGFPAEAIIRYERVLGNLEELPLEPHELLGCADLGWAYAKCGQTTRGMDLIDAVIIKCDSLNNNPVRNMATLWKASILLETGHANEAAPLIDHLAKSEINDTTHLLSFVISFLQAYILCLQEDYEQSMQRLHKCVHNKENLYWGNLHFECLATLEKAGYSHPEISLDYIIDVAISGHDIYLQGLAYYNKAKQLLEDQKSSKKAKECLEKSISLLNRSGANLDLAKVQTLKAKLFIQNGQISQATELLHKALSVLSYVNEKLFPEELKPFLFGTSHTFLPEALADLSEALGAIRDRHQLFNRIISQTIKLVGAGRGGFFQLNDENVTEMVASRNLEPGEKGFLLGKNTLEAIKNALQSGKETVRNGIHSEFNSGQSDSLRWQAVYPVKFRDKIEGCFYLERDETGPELSKHILSILRIIAAQVGVALDNARAYEEIDELKDRFEAESIFYRRDPLTPNHGIDIIGKSPEIQEVIANIIDVAQSDTTVLITGETGVGKELVANAVHQLSDRAKGPFIPVSISSLSEGLLGSELFGHERGAFTNALQTRRGRFELAKRGTLFLDEINSLTMEVQASLLRVLESKCFERVGSSTPIHSDFRLIAASNQPLEQLVEDGYFRPDLFYRLNVYEIIVPPLRRHKTDIPDLLEHFAGQMSKKLNKEIKEIGKEAMACLMEYDWPGNVRELKHIIERALVTCKGNRIQRSDINIARLDAKQESSRKANKIKTLTDMERDHIIKALKQCGWQVSGDKGAAALLAINANTLFSKMKRLGIRKSISHEVIPH